MFKKVIYLLAILLALAVPSHAATIAMDDLTDGSSTVATSWFLVGYDGVTAYRVTIASLFGLKFGTLTDGRLCSYASSTGKISCTTDGSLYAPLAGTNTFTGVNTFQNTVNAQGDGSTTPGKVCFYDWARSTGYFCIQAPETISSAFTLTMFDTLPGSARPIAVDNNGVLSTLNGFSALSVYGGTNYALAKWDSNTPATLDSLATGTAGQGLFSGGSGADPAWSETFGNGTIEPKIQIAVSATNEHYSGIVLSRICGVAAGCTFGQLVHIHTDGEAIHADADSVTTMPCFGIVVSSTCAENAACNILTHGVVTDTDWNWGTIGATLYVSETAGAVEDTVGNITDSGDVVQPIGIVLSADTILFNPSFSIVVLE